MGGESAALHGLGGMKAPSVGLQIRDFILNGPRLNAFTDIGVVVLIKFLFIQIGHDESLHILTFVENILDLWGLTKPFTFLAEVSRSNWGVCLGLGIVTSFWDTIYIFKFFKKFSFYCF